MDKNTQLFFAKLLGKKKKTGCCDVVVEEIQEKEHENDNRNDIAPKCCGEAAAKDLQY